MEIKIIEDYDGEFEEKKESLQKALFPNVKSVESVITIPERKFDDKAYQGIIVELQKKYADELELMWAEIEDKLSEWAK